MMSHEQSGWIGSLNGKTKSQIKSMVAVRASLNESIIENVNPIGRWIWLENKMKKESKIKKKNLLNRMEDKSSM